MSERHKQVALAYRAAWKPQEPPMDAQAQLVKAFHELKTSFDALRMQNYERLVSSGATMKRLIECMDRKQYDKVRAELVTMHEGYVALADAYVKQFGKE